MLFFKFARNTRFNSLMYFINFQEYLPSIGRKIQNLDRKCYMLIEHGLRQSIRLMDTHVCATKDFPVCNVIRQNLG